MGYFYNNSEKEYLIKYGGLPKVLNKVVGKTTKNVKSKNYFESDDRSTYVTKGFGCYKQKNVKGFTPGELDVDNINSFYLGRHVIRDGDRPQKFGKCYPPMSEFYNLNKELFDSNEVYVDKNILLKGCFKSNKVTLQRTMIPDIDCELSGLPTMAKIKQFANPIKNAIRKLQISPISKCTKEDLKFLSFNSSTYPGFHLNKYFNYKNKDEAKCVAFELANRRWDYISKQSKKRQGINRNKIFPNTFVVGARNKREYLFTDDEILTSRAVHMPEFHTEINSAIWIELIKKDIVEKSKGPIYIGNSIVRYERLLKDLKDSDLTIEGDWKRFDSRLYITNVIIGIAILRLYYDFDDVEIDYHFIAMFDTIGIKDYITPGGHLYRMMHGLPSGICSTSLLGSIINLVNLLYCTQDYNSKSIKFIVGGDDFLVAPRKGMNVKSILESMETRADEIGQVFKILETKNLSSDNILERPTFYKYTIDRNEPVVNPIALLERTFLPWNKNYNSNKKILDFLFDLIPSLGAPRTFHLSFYYFFREMFKRVSGRHPPLTEIAKLHKDIYDRVLSGKKYINEDDIIIFKNFSFINEGERVSSSKLVNKFLRYRVRKKNIIKV